MATNGALPVLEPEAAQDDQMTGVGAIVLSDTAVAEGAGRGADRIGMWRPGWTEVDMKSAPERAHPDTDQRRQIETTTRRQVDSTLR